MPSETIEYLELTASIITAFVSRNSVAATELPSLIAATHAAIATLGEGGQPVVEPAKPSPAVPIKKSITADFIICLEDGRKFKSLKRHLRTAYNLTPEQYRMRWGLPPDYPMVAPSYAEARSSMAKRTGLGQQRRKPRGNAA